jgi:hypothetical protein
MLIQIKQIRTNVLGWFRWLDTLVRRLRCNHTHTFSFYPEGVTWRFNGEAQGKHTGVVIEGCYLCGKMWCRDFQA